MAPKLSTARRATLWALAERVLAGAGPDRSSVLEDCERTLASRPATVRLGVRLYLWLLRWLPLLTHGRPFESLPEESRDDVLRRLQSHPIPLLRVGFWGVRTLVLLAHYGRPEVGRSVGYAPASDGNAELLTPRS